MLDARGHRLGVRKVELSFITVFSYAWIINIAQNFKVSGLSHLSAPLILTQI
jgi:hypothetical protein